MLRNRNDQHSIYQYMQAAVDIIDTSPHLTNKIAATIAGEGFALSRVNQWPEAIKAHIGQEPDIGNSSGTVHAETTCILAALQEGHKTNGASIFVTDPPCPNCMKNMVEAGIQELYIDHKGFDKDWAKRRGDSFENMSMRVAAKSGMDVYVIYRKEERFEVISQHPPGYQPAVENPARIKKAEAPFKTLIAQTKDEYKDEPFVIALTKNHRSILVDRHPTVGYTSDTLENKEDKYSFILQPINRLLMIAAKEGLALDERHIYSSRAPTSRELVNFIGAGFSALKIGDRNASRDEFGPRAIKQLKTAGILKLS